MGIVLHEPLTFFVGDAWHIVFNCHDADGSLLDLTGVLSTRWVLDRTV